MKHLSLFAAAALALAIIGCGGTGSTTTAATTGVSQPVIGTIPAIEAVLRVDPSNLKDPQYYLNEYPIPSDLKTATPPYHSIIDPTDIVPSDLINPSFAGISNLSDPTQYNHPALVQDPKNIETGQSILFQLVTYVNGARVILPNVTWFTSDTTQAYGSIGANSGIFLAANNVNQTPLQVFAVYQGQQTATQYDVTTRRAIVVGRVLDATTSAGIAGVTLQFYDQFGTYLGNVTTAYDGAYRASVPVAAAQVQVVSSTIPVAYQWDYAVAGIDYHSGDVDCRTPMTSLETGGSTGLTVGINVLPTPILLSLRSQPALVNFLCTD